MVIQVSFHNFRLYSTPSASTTQIVGSLQAEDQDLAATESRQLPQQQCNTAFVVRVIGLGLLEPKIIRRLEAVCMTVPASGLEASLAWPCAT